MILDGALQFSGAAGAINGDLPTTGSQTSTNIIDLLNARDMGIGDNPAMKLFVSVLTAFTAGTSLQVNFQGAPDNAGSPGTWTTYASSGVTAEASLTVGQHLFDIDVPRPPPGVAIPRFYRLQYVTVGTHTAGAIYGALVLDRDDELYYPPGIKINN